MGTTHVPLLLFFFLPKKTKLQTITKPAPHRTTAAKGTAYKKTDCKFAGGGIVIGADADVVDVGSLSSMST